MNWLDAIRPYWGFAGIVVGSHLLLSIYRKWKWRHWDFKGAPKKTYKTRVYCANCGKIQKVSIACGAIEKGSEHVCRKCMCRIVTTEWEHLVVWPERRHWDTELIEPN